MHNAENAVEAIAIIGLTGRFPGASNIDQFWQNLCEGVESISFFSDEELLASGISAAIVANPNYVKAAGVLDNIAGFDAGFFGFNPREAEIIDPQQRLFLECAWEALEHANCNPDACEGRIGVYAGVSMSSYYLNNLHPNQEMLMAVGGRQTIIGNDKDYLTTRVSYKCNLRGPSFTVQTACSTSLVAVHLACQGLLTYQCDVALAGGSTMAVPQVAGYFYQEGGIASPDGHCRAFDARAQGTVGGSGVGVVVLKRLEDALADRDTIHAVIKGSAMNNDGLLKIGYTAPSIEGQSEVIREALELAGVEAETVGYVEAHGTGTILGDPIEVAALTRAFRASTTKKQFCALGSVKTNVGHLDSAAGVAGLIKTVLALKHQQIPPSLHFEHANPQIDFANSPFFVNTTPTEWKADLAPRRAGVSSFGIGGTNVHAVLEEAPEIEPSGPSRPWQLLILSAKTSTALETASSNLAQHLRVHPELALADVAYTFQVGRAVFDHRRVVVCQDADDALAVLDRLDPQRVWSTAQEASERPVIFMFPGGGAQYIHMGFDLYQTEPVFREQVDQCAELLMPHLNLDVRRVLYPTEADTELVSRQIRQASTALPALFVIEYAMAKLWMAWGIQPHGMVGHSLGEYVAACLAGVFSLSDALALVAMRGKLFEQLPRGAMLSIELAEGAVQDLIGDQLEIAAINGPSHCVVSGSVAAVEQLATLLTEQEVMFRQIHIDVAAHSAMVTPILDTFTEFVATLRLQEPSIPYISNVTGTWITAEEATDPAYWGRHLRQTVRFADGIGELLNEPSRVLLEVGPGQTLSTLVRLHGERNRAQMVVTSIRHPDIPQSDVAFALTTLGKLWLAGAAVDWHGFYAHERRRRVPLPTYSFEHKRYWIEPPAVNMNGARRQPVSINTTDVVLEQAKRPAEGAEFTLYPRPVGACPYIAPRNEVEQTIAAIWQILLGIEQIGIADNFFELGGHSLLVMRLASRLRDTFQVELPLQCVFEACTVAGLAEAIVHARAEAQDRADVEQLLAELEQLSEDDVQRLLAQEASGTLIEAKS